MYLIVVSGAAIENVDSQFGTVKTEIKLRTALFLAFLSVEPVRIDSPSQEYPTPSEVSAYLVVRVGRETEPLVVIAHGVILVIGEMVEHQGGFFSGREGIAGRACGSGCPGCRERGTGTALPAEAAVFRSEERRVGKECTG